MSENTLTRTETDGDVQPFEQRPAVTPAVDIYENEDTYTLIIDMPGVTRQDLMVRLENRELTLEGRVQPFAFEGATALALEFAPVDFRRAFRVPREVNADAIGAELKDGVLTVQLPKASAHKPREIPVRVL